MVPFLQAAPCQQGIVDTDSCRIDEHYASVIFMIPLKIRIVNCVENFLPVFRKIRGDFTIGNLPQLFSEAVSPGNIILHFQLGRNCLLMLRTVCPKVWAVGAFTGNSVRNIEHIFRLGNFAGEIDKNNSLDTLANAALHDMVPDIKAGACSCLRALDID